MISGIQQRLSTDKQQLKERLSLKNMNFANLKGLSKQDAFPMLYKTKDDAKFDIVFADLGFNMVQVDNLEGFAYSKNPFEKIDLRYNKNISIPAYEVLSKGFLILDTFSVYELAQIFSNYGPIKYPQQFAQLITTTRKLSPIISKQDLQSLAAQFTSSKKIELPRFTRLLFQSLRVFVNQESASLLSLLADLPSLMTPSALFVSLSFNENEHRTILKNLKGFKINKMLKIAKKEELNINKASKSARLIVAVRG